MSAAKRIRLKSCQRWWDNLTPDDDGAEYDAEQDALRDEMKIKRERHRKGVRNEHDGDD